VDGRGEALWQDYVRFGELFGLPRSAAPASYREFRAYWRERLAGDGLHLPDEARYMGYASAFEIPMPLVNQPAKRVHDLIMLGSLLPRVRELYGLPFTPAQAAAFRLATHAVRTALPLAPAGVARGLNTRSFELVAGTERRRIVRGRPTPQIRDGDAAGRPARAAEPAAS
jgi:uncharacterized protein (DUF2236 family)